MPVTLRLPSNERVTFDQPVILIGTDENCDVRLPADSGGRPQHATIRKLAGRWLAESQGDWLLQVGTAQGKTCWLTPGDAIHIAPQGPMLIFEPPAIAAITSAANQPPGQSAVRPAAQRPPPPPARIVAMTTGSPGSPVTAPPVGKAPAMPPPLPGRPAIPPSIPSMVAAAVQGTQSGGHLNQPSAVKPPVPPPLPAAANAGAPPPSAQAGSAGKGIAKDLLVFGAGAVAGAALNALGLHGKARGAATKGVKRWVRGALAKDTDGDGAADVVGIDSDGDGKIDAVAIDRDHDGRIDAMGFDTNRDGHIDTIAADTDGDGDVDFVAHEIEDDGADDDFDDDGDDDDGDDFDWDE